MAEDRLNKQLCFIANRLDEIGVSGKVKFKVLRLIAVDLHKRLPRDATPAVKVKPQVSGVCLCCGVNAILVDGFLCESCFEEHEK